MANILAIDTSSDGCSAALVAGEEVYSRFDCEPRQHTKLIMGMVKSVLSEAGFEKNDIDAVAFGAGPGSFTGLRISAGIVQGLAAGLDKPVIAVSTLQALASDPVLNSHTDCIVLPALDARMGEIYWGAYKRSQSESGVTAVPLIDDSVVKPADAFKIPNQEISNSEGLPIVGIGSGWCYREELFSAGELSISEVFEAEVAKAEVIALIGQEMWESGVAKPPHEGVPVYIRNEITWKKLPGR